MLQSIKKYNGLNGVKVSKEDLLKLSNELYNDKQTGYAEEVFKLSKNIKDNEQRRVKLLKKATEEPTEELLQGCEYDENPNEMEFTGLNKAISSAEIYEAITKQLIDKINNTDKKYIKSWSSSSRKGWYKSFNWRTKKPYTGINNIILTVAGFEPLQNPFFMTFKQGKAAGLKLRKGSIGIKLVKYTIYYDYNDFEGNKYTTGDKTKMSSWRKRNLNKLKGRFNHIDEDPYLQKRASVSYFNVFSALDFEGFEIDLEPYKKPFFGYVDADDLNNTDEKIQSAEDIMKNYPNPQPPLRHGGDKAFYMPSADYIQMPHYEDFKTGVDYYRTLLHEAAHSTGHEDRLERDFSGKFGSKKYAYEELVAETTSVFLSSWAGILWHTNTNHETYLKSWAKVLRQNKEDDPAILIKAARDAQKAADFILQLNENGVPKFIYNGEDKINKYPEIKKDKVKQYDKEEAKNKKAIQITKPKRVVKKAKEVVKVDKNGQTALFGSAKKKSDKLTGLKGTKKRLIPSAKAVDTGISTNNASNTQNVPTGLIYNNIEVIPTPADEIEPTPTVPAVIKRSVKPTLSNESKSLVKSLANLQNNQQAANYYQINGDLAEFLGQVEIKPFESVAITLDAPQGAGKTRFVFQALNIYATAGYKCLFVSLEEHPQSNLFLKKADQYINPSNNHLIDTVGELPNGYDDLKKLIPSYDIIFIDSWSKIAEENRKIDFDKDLRKKFNSKLFFTIFQRTSAGTMRGGSKSAFDGDIILKMHKDEDFRKSYVYPDKNRYQSTPLDELKYSIFNEGLIREKPQIIPPKTTVQPPTQNKEYYSFIEV